jgi:hypothetical protein
MLKDRAFVGRIVDYNQCDALGAKLPQPGRNRQDSSQEWLSATCELAVRAMA